MSRTSTPSPPSTRGGARAVREETGADAGRQCTIADRVRAAELAARLSRQHSSRHP